MKYNKDRSCKNCIKGTTISINSDILCREKGIVSSDYLCSSHRYQPDSKPFMRSSYKCVECEHFVISDDINESTTYGVCHLFSVRKCDGSKKKACSKFSKKNELAVS